MQDSCRKPVSELKGCGCGCDEGEVRLLIVLLLLVYFFRLVGGGVWWGLSLYGGLKTFLFDFFNQCGAIHRQKIGSTVFVPVEALQGGQNQMTFELIDSGF